MWFNQPLTIIHQVVKDNSLALQSIHIHQRGDIVLMRIHEAKQVSMPDNILEGVIVTYCFFCKLHVLFTEMTGHNIKTKFPHASHIYPELQRLLTPISNMVVSDNRRKEIGIIPLHKNPLQRISIIAGPELSKIFQ